jgi:predicted DNA-binding protein with PD1-like motif
MKLIAESGTERVLNAERGDELINTLLEWCATKRVSSATFTGLGACDALELAYYNLRKKKYERHLITEELEILSLTGNIGTLDGKPVVHVHGVFGRRDLSTLGGHLFSLRVSGACEIHMTVLTKEIQRKHDSETGLNLMCDL